MKASHKEIEQMVGMTKVVLQPGQFIYGRHIASVECGLSPSTVRNCMDWLKNNQTLDIKSDNKKSVVTLINWALYQANDEEKDSKKDSCRTTTGQQQDTNKNDKNLKNLRNNPPTPQTRGERYDYFADFWEAYPRKEKKALAKKIFERIKMTDELMEKIMDSLYQFRISDEWKREGGRFIPHPTTWLNQRRWEDNVE